jgi:hypothetical protein
VFEEAELKELYLVTLTVFEVHEIDYQELIWQASLWMPTTAEGKLHDEDGAHQEAHGGATSGL